MLTWQIRFTMLLVFVACILNHAKCAPDDAEPVPTDFVTRPVHVVYPDNSPATETTVTLHSMARIMRKESELEARLFPPIITDARGSATLRYPTSLNSFSGWKLSPIYAVVEPTANHAGAIVGLSGSETSEALTIKISAGYTLRGTILGPDGHPMTTGAVSINHDLHANTHTGYGGEIWKRETTVNSSGNFNFLHVNPSPVTIGLAHNPSSYWEDTYVNGQPMYDCVDEFQPEWNDVVNEIEIHLAASPARIYQGVAVDEDGNPVANARVTIGYSWYSRKDNDRSWKTTKTLSDGSWRLEVPTKWITWGDIRQPGAPGPTTGTAHIAAVGKIDLGITASQVVRLHPVDSDRLMPFSD